MITLTKEWLQQTIAELEEERDAVPGVVNEDAARALAAMKLALASLEAEAVHQVLTGDAWVDLSKGAMESQKRVGAIVRTLYAAPPAPAPVNAEPVAWLWSNRKHPSEVTLVRPEDDEKAEAALWSGWSYKALYAEPPVALSVPGVVNEDAPMALAAMKLALASLEAEPVAWIIEGGKHDTPCHLSTRKEYAEAYPDRKVTPLYTAPPAPVSVPDELLSAMEEVLRISDRDHEAWHKVKAGILSCRAAMLQGADGALTNEDTKRVGELVMWVKRLAHSLRKANPDSKLQSDAMDYLSRKGLIGVEDILR